MMRISPFSEARDVMPDPKRVNLWPLIYQNQDHTSALWPVVDVDPNGFAVRPVLNKEKNDWSVLFPLSSYNAERKVGWLGPLYRYESYHGLFPMYHWSKDIKSLGPAWWTAKGHYGVFPLAGNGRNLDYIGPFYRLSRNDDWVFKGFFPFLGIENTSSHFWLWPLYAQDLNEEERVYSILSGLIHSRTEANGNYRRRVLPLYYAKRSEDSQVRVLFPLWFQAENAHGRVNINPLFGRGSDKDGRGTFTNILGPLFVRSHPPDHPEQRDTWLMALAHYGTVEGRKSARLTPLVAVSNDDEYPDFLYHLALLSYRNVPNDFHFSLTPLIGRRHWKHENGNFHQKSWVWPVFSASRGNHYARTSFLLTSYRKQYEDDELRSVDFKFPLRLVSYKHDLKEDITTGSLAWGLVNYKQDQERSRFSILKYLYRRDRDGEHIARDIFPFIKWDSGPEKSRFALLWRLLNVETREDGIRGHLLFVPFGGK